MNLFPEQPISFQKGKLIRSVSTSQEEILLNIMQLHLPAGIECDCCYNKGSFYKGSIPPPKLKFDLTPQTNDTVEADCRHLPLEDNSLGSLIYDPPFIFGTNVNSEEHLMSKKYTSFKSRIEMEKFFTDSISEFARIIKPKGILIVKAQDIVGGRKRIFSSKLIINEAEARGFKLVDEFILIAKNRFTGNYKNQFHARSFHSFFMVFKKSKCTPG